jgi:hypothetical protein
MREKPRGGRERQNDALLHGQAYWLKRRAEINISLPL